MLVDNNNPTYFNSLKIASLIATYANAQKIKMKKSFPWSWQFCVEYFTKTYVVPSFRILKILSSACSLMWKFSFFTVLPLWYNVLYSLEYRTVRYGTGNSNILFLIMRITLERWMGTVRYVHFLHLRILLHSHVRWYVPYGTSKTNSHFFLTKISGCASHFLFLASIPDDILAFLGGPRKRYKVYYSRK